jgi:hypothetical protein
MRRYARCFQFTQFIITQPFAQSTSIFSGWLMVLMIDPTRCKTPEKLPKQAPRRAKAVSKGRHFNDARDL